MEDSKRLILAFVLVMAILFFWQILFLPREPVKKKIESATAAERQESTLERKEEVSLRGNEWTMENSKILVKLSNDGGTIRSVYLKEYKCELLKDFSYLPLRVLENGREFRLDTLIWCVDTQSKRLTFWVSVASPQGEKDGQFVFYRHYWLEPVASRKAGGVDDYKLFSEIEYSVTLPRSEENISQASAKVYPESIRTYFVLSFDRGLAFTEEDTNEEYNHFRILLKKDKTLREIPVRKLKGLVKERGDWDWFGFASKYFLMVVKGNFDSLHFSPSAGRKMKNDFFPTVGEKVRFSLGFYPLKYKLLAQSGEGLEKSIPLGWPKFLSLGILHLLLFLYSILKNYGVVIIVFSFLMKGILFPLTRFQLREMKKLQQLQPKLEELRRKYKNDPKTLNQETMRLYSIHKMNPLSGCLPLLAQIPIFWALYSVLRSTFELRRASFIFWLKDLSQKDPFYLLPILMGVSFLFQNLLTTQDKKNLFMTIFFPIFLTVIFLNFPSGLQLYWLTFNLLSLVESFIVQRGGKKWKK